MISGGIDHLIFLMVKCIYLVVEIGLYGIPYIAYSLNIEFSSGTLIGAIFFGPHNNKL